MCFTLLTKTNIEIPDLPRGPYIYIYIMVLIYWEKITNEISYILPM